MIEKLFDLTDRVAIVTGASSGFGVVFAHALAEAGADVVVAARRKERLEQTAQGVRERGRRCLVMQTDVSQEDQIDDLVAKTMEEFGRIDIVVNNAARGGMAMWTETTTLEEYRTHSGHQPDWGVHADAEGGAGDARPGVGENYQHFLGGGGAGRAGERPEHWILHGQARDGRTDPRDGEAVGQEGCNSQPDRARILPHRTDRPFPQTTRR